MKKKLIFLCCTFALTLTLNATINIVRIPIQGTNIIFKAPDFATELKSFITENNISIVEAEDILISYINQKPNNITESFDTIQNTVGAAECLDQAVHLEVFIDPQSIERCGIESREEHIDNDKQVKLLVFHTERDVFIIALESIAVGGIVRMEHSVIVGNSFFKEVAVGSIQSTCILGVFLVKDTVSFFLICAIAIDNSNL